MTRPYELLQFQWDLWQHEMSMCFFVMACEPVSIMSLWDGFRKRRKLAVFYDPYLGLPVWSSWFGDVFPRKFIVVESPRRSCGGPIELFGTSLCHISIIINIYIYIYIYIHYIYIHIYIHTIYTHIRVCPWYPTIYPLYIPYMYHFYMAARPGASRYTREKFVLRSSMAFNALTSFAPAALRRRMVPRWKRASIFMSSTKRNTTGV